MFSVIFEVHPGEGKKDEYLGYAKELKPEIETIDGFIDNERFESRLHPGWVLSLSTWRDEKSVIRWRTQAKHHVIQEKGRFEVFSDYHLRVGEITQDTHPPLPLREERFDTTEVGKSKLCTIVELVPEKRRDLPKDDDALLGAIGLDRAATGLNEINVYDSIYNSGKVLVLGSWAEPEHAEPFRPGAVEGAETVRRRAVRIIRQYGMFDRRENTMYYSEVQRKG
ncbi:antibiotic biosynthesis monooxygenase [Methylobacterium sp. C1]|uniref:antibiotic biosynthesis monooxygenase family protein n=1 Tax=Methylobacterium sp. C1 TaxID=1479019 RepID=UPI0008DAB17F|nr:antibiotic biosynthesis monooxygenase [Methylobacterium sp. C1]